MTGLLAISLNLAGVKPKFVMKLGDCLFVLGDLQKDLVVSGSAALMTRVRNLKHFNKRRKQILPSSFAPLPSLFHFVAPN